MPIFGGRRRAGLPSSVESNWPQHDDIMRIVVADVDELRRMSLVAQDESATSFVVIVEHWSAPVAGWRGVLGYLPTSLTMSMTFVDSPAVEFRVQFAEQQSANLVARAVLRALVPAAAPLAWRSPLVAVAADSAPSPVGTLGQPLSAVTAEPDPDTLRGADLLVLRKSSALAPNNAELAYEAAWTEEGQDLHRNAVARVTPAVDYLPLIDMLVHRPVERLRATAAGKNATLVADGERWLIKGPKGGTIVALQPHRSLSQADAMALSKVARLDLTAARAPMAGESDEQASRATRGTPGAGDAHPTASLGRRIAEVAACGVELHSADSRHPAWANWPSELRELMATPPTSGGGLHRAARSLRQRRIALQAFSGLLRTVRAGGGSPSWPRLPEVSIVLVSRRPGELLTVLRALSRQTYPHLEIVVAVHGEPIDAGLQSTLNMCPLVTRILSADASEPFGSVLGRASACASGDLLTKVDDDDFYGPDHVWDLVLARYYSGAQIVGKRAQYVHFQDSGKTIERNIPAERYGHVVAGGTILIGVGDLTSVGGWRPTPRSVDRALIERVRAEGGIVYATEGIGYVYVRHSLGHTWQVTEEEMMGTAIATWTSLHADLAVSADGSTTEDEFR